MFCRHIALQSILVNLLAETFLQNLFQTHISLKVTVFIRYRTCWNVFFITRNVITFQQLCCGW